MRVFDILRPERHKISRELILASIILKSGKIDARVVQAFHRWRQSLLNHYLDRLGEKMLSSKRSSVSSKLHLLEKVFLKRMYYVFRRWHDQTVKSEPKVQMILSNYAKQKKSSLVLANIIQR